MTNLRPARPLPLKHTERTCPFCQTITPHDQIGATALCKWCQSVYSTLAFDQYMLERCSLSIDHDGNLALNATKGQP
jgi:hypothetical protein